MGKACYDCVRILMIVFNFIFVLCGLAISSMGIYFFVQTFALNMNGLSSSLAISLYVMMGTGALTVILGIFGCCGAYNYSRCLLGTYFTLLLILFAAEIAAGVVGFLMRDEVIKSVDKVFAEGVDQKKLDKSVSIKWMDVIQKTLKCCGKNGPTDYGLNVPASCCHSGPDVCNSALSALTNYFSKGCSGELEKSLNNNIPIVCGILLGIAIIELFGLIFSMALCCGIEPRQYYSDVPMA